MNLREKQIPRLAALARDDGGLAAKLASTMCLAIAMLLTMTPGARAQNVEGQIIASQYGTWKVPGYAADAYNFSPTGCRVQGGASFFQAFTAGTSIRIVDGNPNLSEVVTPSSVVVNSSTCSITIHPVNHHEPPFYFTSATGGLQEAINANIAIPGPNTIILNNAWYRLGGSAAIIASVQGSSSLGLVDITQTPSKWYQWNGSQYAQVQPSGGGAGTLVNDLVSNSTSDSFQDLYHFYATSPAYNTQNAVNAAAASGGSVTIQPGAGHSTFSSNGSVSITDHRQDVLAQPKSIKEFGGQCDGTIASGTFTSGSNQVTGVNVNYNGTSGYLYRTADLVGASLWVGYAAADGSQWAWEPIITAATGSGPNIILTTNENAPSNISVTPPYAFEVGHDDTAAFQAIAGYYPSTEITFPGSGQRACMTHAVTYSAHDGIEWRGQGINASVIMGAPGEDVLKFQGDSPSRLTDLSIKYDSQIDATEPWTLVDATNTETAETPLRRWYGQGTSWANDPLLSGWTSQELASAQGTTDTKISLSNPVINYGGDQGYIGVAPYGCVKIDNEIECYENYTSNPPNKGYAADTLNNVTRGNFQSLGFSAATTHAANATVVPVHPFSPLTPYITPNTAYNFLGITLQRTSNVVTVTLPSSTAVFGVTGAQIEIIGTGSGDFAGTFNVVSASGTAVTYDQTGANEGPVVAASAYAGLAGTYRPTIWPAFKAGNAAIATDSPDGLTGTISSANYAVFSQLNLEPATPSYESDADRVGQTGGAMWLQGALYNVWMDHLQMVGDFGLLHVPPQINTNVLPSFDNETNTWSNITVHSGRPFVLSNESNGSVKNLNAYSEEPTGFAGIGPSMFPVCNDQTGVCNEGNASDFKWDNIYSEPGQYTTQYRAGAYEEYWENNSHFGSGVWHLNNSGWTIFHGSRNHFDNLTIVTGGFSPEIFIDGDQNNGTFNLEGLLSTSLATSQFGRFTSMVIDEGEHNVCFGANGGAVFSLCRGIVRSGGTTSDWLKLGPSSVAAEFPSSGDLILSAQDLVNSGQWGTSVTEGIDLQAPGSFAYAAQPYTAFASGSIRPNAYAETSDIGTRFPNVHGTLYFTAKASTSTNETFHAYYVGAISSCGNGSPQYIDSSGSSTGITEALTTSWQVFSFGVNLQDAPGRTGTSSNSNCVFGVGDDQPSASGAEIDIGSFQFVPDFGTINAVTANATTVNATTVNAATVNAAKINSSGSPQTSETGCQQSPVTGIQDGFTCPTVGWINTSASAQSSTDTTLTLSFAVNNLSPSGCFEIDTEIECYTTVSGGDTVLGGLIRGSAAYESTAAAHGAGANIQSLNIVLGSTSQVPKNVLVGGGTDAQVLGINNTYPSNHSGTAVLSINGGSNETWINTSGGIQQVNPEASNIFQGSVAMPRSTLTVGAISSTFMPRGITNTDNLLQTNGQNQAQQPIGFGAGIAGPVESVQPQAIGAPSILSTAGTGTTTYTYECTGSDVDGNTIPGTTASVTAPAVWTPVSQNTFIQISCPYVAGVVTWQVWRTAGMPNTGILASGSGSTLVALDYYTSAASGTPPTANTTVPKICTNGEQFCILSGTSATSPVACASGTEGWEYHDVEAMPAHHAYICESGTWTGVY